MLNAKARGYGQLLLDNALHRLSGIDDGLAKIASRDDSLQSFEIPFNDRPVKTIFLVHFRFDTRRQLCHLFGQWIARQGGQQKESGRCNDKQGQNHQREPARKISKHVVSSVEAAYMIRYAHLEPTRIPAVNDYTFRLLIRSAGGQGWFPIG
ncbi:hypothetical protein D3C81_1200780 [compost metagenome]